MPRTTRVDVKLKFSAGRQDIDHAEIEKIRYSPGVQHDIHRRADNVADYMRLNVGVKTGKLISTIRTEDSGADVNVMVGRAGQTPYLGYHMYGTGHHVILPRGPWDLVFFWEKLGARVRFAKVNHPGNGPNTFVYDSVRAAAR